MGMMQRSGTQWAVRVAVTSAVAVLGLIVAYVLSFGTWTIPVIVVVWAAIAWFVCGSLQRRPVEPSTTSAGADAG
jgi:uncharacterized membrane protein